MIFIVTDCILYYIALRDFYFCVRRRLVDECFIAIFLLRGIATIFGFSGWIIHVCCDVIILDLGG